MGASPFDNWDSRLDGAIPFDSSDLTKQLTEAGLRIAPEQVLDQLFRSTMERLDGEARAAESGTLSIAPASFRLMPESLFALLKEQLPEPLAAGFHELVAHPENERAWKTLDLRFKERVEAKTDRILDILENQLQRAQNDGRLARNEADAERTRAKEWEEQYCKLEADTARHNEEPGEIPLASLLKDGDLDGAMRLKTEQIEKRKGEVKRLARDWSELGSIHDLRFAWKQAMECYREAWKLDRDEPEYGFRYAYFARKQNRFDEAIDAYLELLPVYSDPASVLNDLAILYRATQRMKEAETAYSEALFIRRRLAAANPGTHSAHVASALNNLAVLYSDTQRMKEAEAAYEEALSIRKQLAEANPETYLPDVAVTLNNLAVLYSDTQRVKEAETAYQNALSIYRGLAASTPETYLSEVAMTLDNLANLYRDTQRMKDAETAYKEALSIRRWLAEDNPEAYWPHVAATLNNLANLYSDTWRMKDAATAYQEALSTFRRLAKANPEVYWPYVATTLNNLANLYSDLQHMKEAQTAHQEALSIRRKLAETNPEAYVPDVAATLNNMAYLYRATHQLSAAEQCCLEAEVILEPLWREQPELHGNQMARILLLRALLAGTEHQGEACRFARRGLAAAFDPQLKQSLERFIDQVPGKRV